MYTAIRRSMKPAETKAEFIKLRAEGKSYSFIGSELGLSKDTCHRWERELSEAIAELKREQMEELYTAYKMTKEARIRRLGDTLENIDTALAQVDLRTVPPEKLLDFKLKYTEALRGEYTGSQSVLKLGDSTDASIIVKALSDLLERVRSGDVTTEQAQKESSVLAQLIKAYDLVELKAKLETLEGILESRK